MKNINCYGVIYKTTNLINGKLYIGQTKRNGYALQIYLGSGVLLKQAITKYGIASFEKEIICECNSKEQINRMERLYIAILKPDYNLAKGGFQNPYDFLSEEDKQKAYKKHSESMKKRTVEQERERLGKIKAYLNNRDEKTINETKRRQSEASKKLWEAKSLEYKTKFKNRMSELHKGKTVSNYTKEKLSTIAKEQQLNMTDEEKKEIAEKISKAQRLYWDNMSEEDLEKIRSIRKITTKGGKNAQAKKCICIETGEVFSYMGEAAEKIYGKKSRYPLVAEAMKTGKTIQGYSWKAYEEEKCH